MTEEELMADEDVAELFASNIDDGKYAADLTDLVIGEVRKLKKPLEKCNETQQQDFINTVANRITAVMKRVGEEAAAADHFRIQCSLKATSIKGSTVGINSEALNRPDTVLALASNGSAPMFLVFPDYKTIADGTAPTVEAVPDQGELPMEKVEREAREAEEARVADEAREAQDEQLSTAAEPDAATQEGDEN